MLENRQFFSGKIRPSAALWFVSRPVRGQMTRPKECRCYDANTWPKRDGWRRPQPARRLFNSGAKTPVCAGCRHHRFCGSKPFPSFACEPSHPELPGCLYICCCRIGVLLCAWHPIQNFVQYHYVIAVDITAFRVSADGVACMTKSVSTHIPLPPAWKARAISLSDDVRIPASQPK